MSRFIHDVAPGRRLRIGMIGGGQGAYFAGLHRAAMRLSNRFDLVAGAFSSDPLNCRATGEALRINPERNYSSFVDMARVEASRDRDRLDAVVIVTPNFLHFEPCKLFLEAGIPIICDKPLVNNSDDARELVHLADDTGLFFAVTYTYTGYPMVRDARARVLAGEIGDVRMMYAEYLLEWLANDPGKLNKGGVWRGDPAKAGPTGCMGDIGTHAFNILEFVSGKRCTALHARLDRVVPSFGLDDTDMLLMAFEDGASAMMWCSLAAPGHRNGLSFKIVGTLGTLEWHQEEPETLRLSRLGQADLIYRRGQSDNTPDALAAASLPAGNPESYLEALAVLYCDYADALAAGDNWRKVNSVPIACVCEGLRGVILSEISVRSSQSRSWIEFPKEGAA